MTDYKANIYPNTTNNVTIENADDSRENIAICFSGGGSRALTCAWGQMLGLNTLSLMDKARYISSVSGGTWAASVYTFLPDTITDEQLLGTYCPPKQLSLKSVNTMPNYRFGKSPQSLGVWTIAKALAKFTLEHDKKNYKWFWASLIAEHVLGEFDLRAEDGKPWESSKSFSLSADYVEKNFPADASPSTGELFFTRKDRPFLIMNDNIMQKQATSNKAQINVIQLPNQVTAVAGGAKGQTPDKTIVGGGLVETYGVCSELEQNQASESPVNISISQQYSLIDIVSTSSAFFAEWITRHFSQLIQNSATRKLLVDELEKDLSSEIKDKLLGKFDSVFNCSLDFSNPLDKGIHDLEKDGKKLEKDGKKIIDDGKKAGEKVLSIPEKISQIVEHDLIESIMGSESFATSFVPEYNYWPIGKESENKAMNYTDGGTLDNLGILGLLSQTDTGMTGQEPIKVVVFDNTSVPLKKKKSIIAASAAAPLFGINFNEDTGSNSPFTPDQQDPTNKAFISTSLTTVFDNSKTTSGTTPFEQLINGLYTSNNDETSPAFHQIELTTVANSLANISGGRKVTMLYVQNAAMKNWLDKVGDPKLQEEIARGQNSRLDLLKYEATLPNYDELSELILSEMITPESESILNNDFEGFPYYSTFTKIGLEPKESNALSQMWAWAIADDASPLKKRIQDFMS